MPPALPGSRISLVALFFAACTPASNVGSAPKGAQVPGGTSSAVVTLPAPAGVTPDAAAPRKEWTRVPMPPNLRVVYYDWKRRARSDRTPDVLDPDEEVRMVCGAEALLGPPSTTEYFDIAYAAESASGAILGIRVDPEYGRLALLGDKPDDAQVAAFTGALRGAVPSDCEHRMAVMGTASVQGIRGGVVFRRDATPDEGLTIHAARTMRVAALQPSASTEPGSPAWHTDDWALYYLLETASRSFAARRSELEAPLTQAFVRWLAYRAVGASALGSKAHCGFLNKVRKLLPGTTPEQKKQIAAARCP